MSYFTCKFKRKNFQEFNNEEFFEISGHVYLDNRPVTPEELAEHFSSSTIENSLTARLRQLNGFYSWISQKNNYFCAGVDHIRSHPIFYGQTHGKLYISDEAEWVRQQVGDTEMDPLAREEFLLAGYVTGRDTLYKNVKQLQAGEYLEARLENETIDLKISRYFRFLHKEPATYILENLEAELERVTINSMRRLIEHASGRQILIPLSGGYDSRLIASILKKLKYQNVLCFTYGIPGNKEAELSRLVAGELGFDWVFVEYSEELWRNEWSTPEAAAYRHMASNHVSLPHVQDWLAVKHLISKKIISSDAIMAPGHSGDFVAGSHIPNSVFTKKTLTENELIKSLIDTHLSNAPHNDLLITKENYLKSRIKNRMDLKFDGTNSGFANLYELWDWQERQAKYIVNSVRVYDQFNIDWWLPQWDLEFVSFWQNVPLALRKNRTWFKEWISFQYKLATNENKKTTTLSSKSNIFEIRKTLIFIANKLPSPLLELIKNIYQKNKLKNHSLALQGLISHKEISTYTKKKYNIIGIYSDLFLRGKWK